MWKTYIRAPTYTNMTTITRSSLLICNTNLSPKLARKYTPKCNEINKYILSVMHKYAFERIHTLRHTHAHTHLFSRSFQRLWLVMCALRVTDEGSLGELFCVGNKKRQSSQEVASRSQSSNVTWKIEATIEIKSRLLARPASQTEDISPWLNRWSGNRKHWWSAPLITGLVQRLHQRRFGWKINWT